MAKVEGQRSKAKGRGQRAEGRGQGAGSPAALDNPKELISPLAARILADPDIAVFIKPFMRGAATVKAAAAEFGQPIQTLHYRVEQMLEAGLLEVARLEQRRGRPVKHYRATAAAFRVATSLVPPRILQALEDQISWKATFEQALEQVGRDKGYPHQVVMYYLEADDILVWADRLEGTLEAPSILEGEAPAVLNHWSGAVYLDRADAKAFKRELWELYQRYAHRQGREKYVVHLGLAPSPK